MTGAAEPVRAIRIAILAMGGEGGGVLAGWIVDMAEQKGFIAQMTSVPGVAQRTGATIYYIELIPAAACAGRKPVLALMPAPGDVDVVVASELMEAARAVQRGLVTPDRTTLVASTHRVYAMTEKIPVGDGRVDPARLHEACAAAARKLVAADMAAIAERTGSQLSAALFGALTASGALPFDEVDALAAIERAGVGVTGSKRAFAEAMTVARLGTPANDSAPATAAGPAAAAAGPLAHLLETFPASCHPTLRLGLARLADYQDAAYAREYLDRLQPVAEADARHGEGSGALIETAARELALGMSYEDPIRVAELKIRADRFARVRSEVGAADGQIVRIAEFMHPRLEEISQTLPAPLGRFLARNGLTRRLIQRATRRGKVVRTTSIGGFLTLYAVAKLRRWRRTSLRHDAEMAYLTDWLAGLVSIAARDYPLAVELAKARGLVRGYGDTHARGLASYRALRARAADLTGSPGSAARLAVLRKAAEADDTGKALQAALAADPRSAA